MNSLPLYVEEEAQCSGELQQRRMIIDRITCDSVTDHGAWDDLASQLGGGFFHCYAYAASESCSSNTRALFVKAFDQQGDCVGIAIGHVVSPRVWPFTTVCKTAVFGALPATKYKSVDAQQAIMAAIERELKRRGVYQLKVSAYDSVDSGSVLSALSYELTDRVEICLDMSYPIDELWKQLKGSRRTDIRKATKLGVETKVENSRACIQQLHRFQAQSLTRQGVLFDFNMANDSSKNILLDAGRGMLLMSYHGGVSVNAAFFGVFGDKAYYLASGSSIEGNKCCGSAHLLWTAIELLKNQGVRTLNLGGVVGGAGDVDSKNGLYSFKQDFGGVVLPEPAGVKVISQTGAKLNTALNMLKRTALACRS